VAVLVIWCALLTVRSVVMQRDLINLSRGVKVQLEEQRKIAAAAAEMAANAYQKVENKHITPSVHKDKP
jgi:hypothetical protein